MFRARNCAKLAERYLETYPALCLFGARQVGKTALARHLRPDWRYFDLDNADDFSRISRGPQLFFEQYPSNLIIDGVEKYPAIFKTLRDVIDKNRSQKNRFIFISSSDRDLADNLSDGLSELVGVVYVGTLKANEAYEKPLSNFYEIFTHAHDRNSLEKLSPQLSNAQMRQSWLYGGYPGFLFADETEPFQTWMENYFCNYIDRDISQNFSNLDKIGYQKFIKRLLPLTGRVINHTDLARVNETNEKAVRDYLDIAEQSFLWRSINYDTYTKDKTVVKRPKGLLRDSGLQHFMQGITDLDQLLKHPICGHSFESFIIEEIIKGIMATGKNNIDVHYFRTAHGAEVDLVVTCEHSVIPIEIKMGKMISLKSLSSLSAYIENNKLPYGLLLNQCETPIWVTKNIFALPIGVL